MNWSELRSDLGCISTWNWEQWQMYRSQWHSTGLQQQHKETIQYMYTEQVCAYFACRTLANELLNRFASVEDWHHSGICNDLFAIYTLPISLRNCTMICLHRHTSQLLLLKCSLISLTVVNNTFTESLHCGGCLGWCTCRWLCWIRESTNWYISIVNNDLIKHWYGNSKPWQQQLWQMVLKA